MRAARAAAVIVSCVQELDFCIFDLSDLDLHKKACPSDSAWCTVRLQSWTTVEEILASQQVSNDLLDKFGHVAENAGEYLVHNQAGESRPEQPRRWKGSCLG